LLSCYRYLAMNPVTTLPIYEKPRRLLLYSAARISALALAGCMLVCALGQRVASNDPTRYGPYNAALLPDGLGLRIPLSNSHDAVLLPDAAWTLFCWFRAQDSASGLELIAGVGNVSDEYPRFLALDKNRVVLWQGVGNEISAAVAMKPAEWHLLTATFDGVTSRLYFDGAAKASGTLQLGTANPLLQIAPTRIVSQQAAHFGGKVAGFSLLRRAQSVQEIQQMYQQPPDFDLLAYSEASRPWPVQTRAQAGYSNPQSPEQIPTSRGGYSQPVAVERPPASEFAEPGEAGEWSLGDNWTLREAPKVNAGGAELSQPSFAGKGWMRATVPGTVLTTLVDDGIYPDPYYGLNNLAIPETLNKQDYWYREVFRIPTSLQPELMATGARVDLTFKGINYAAEVWLNGSRLGSIKGAFTRGTFDVTSLMKTGERNALAIRVSPPPHPGIPQEQSVLGGPGENGGAMELDGPTFLATEGWDWIPAIRDRDSGIWQPVTLSVSRQLTLGDTQVLSTFNGHDTSHAALTITVPVVNRADHPIEAILSANVGSVKVEKHVRLTPGPNEVTLRPSEFPQLNLDHPRLWWPNGYGKPELYTANLEVRYGDVVADTRRVRFGVREVSYELSLLDSSGHLRRVEFTPSAAPNPHPPIVDVSHDGMRQIPGADATALDIPEEKRDDYRYSSWVSSLTPGGEQSPAIEPLQESAAAPYLVLKVNGVRIAVRGGNWGMDDAMKRVSRSHLEPFFRLNRDAHMNIIRNWVGQNTEETFYELADEYGLMVWNDFWESTENYNLEAEDPTLFLENASDTIRRFRNHPSIVMWCGRNEGVPQPVINMGLETLVRSLDGTRFYTPSSNQINLQQSGPYSYQNPSLYYTSLNRGFSVETGTPSMSTLESFEKTTPAADQWPMDDVWAYHDWHASGNGRVGPFMAEIEAEFGAPTSLSDFERKAQLLNYVDHRAIFEGMTANLWAPNSGRLLWMTQPAWPSTMWQILSSDYDTQASFFGTMKAAEPLHVQLNLATYQVDVVNTTTEPLPNLTVSAKVFSLRNELLLERTEGVAVKTDDTQHSFNLALAPLLQRGLVFVELRLLDNAGKELARNLYWLGARSESYRELNSLPRTSDKLTASARNADGETIVTAVLTNNDAVASLANKLTLVGPHSSRILPAYFSDNYISLLPGESETVTIHFAESAGRHSVRLAVRGWNGTPQTINIQNVP
jgi:hypothetical protein